MDSVAAPVHEPLETSRSKSVPEAPRQPLTAQRPFPGPDPYSEADAAYFFGRDEEINALQQCVSRGTLTVLFGASGLGKTSLLRAGLLPRLRRAGALPIEVRLELDPRSAASFEPPDLSRQIMTRVREAAWAAGVEAENAEDCSTLWEFFHRVELWSDTSSLTTPVLVFDQFEEVFTLGGRTAPVRESVDRLFAALSDLVENRSPNADASAREERPELDDFLRRKAPAKVILSLREEYLPHLMARKRDMPSLTLDRGRLWLQPFRGDRAADVLRLVAASLWEAAVPELVVKAVAARTTSADKPRGGTTVPQLPSAALSDLTVEPSLLNLFCFQLNERRIRLRKPKIDRALVEEAGRDILSEFYAHCMAGQSRRVRRFVEHQLISSSGHRLSVPEVDAIEQHGLDPSAIEILERRRLIRREYRYQTTHIELVHDVVAGTIVRVRIERRQRWKARWRAVVSVGMVLMAGVGIIALSMQGDIEQANLWTEKAKKAQAHAELEERKAQDAQQLKATLVSEALAVRSALDITNSELREAQRQTARAEAEAQEFRSKAASARSEAERSLRVADEARKRLAALSTEVQQLQAEREALKRKNGIPETLE